jgi:hypothetical protein
LSPDPNPNPSPVEAYFGVLALVLAGTNVLLYDQVTADFLRAVDALCGLASAALEIPLGHLLSSAVTLTVQSALACEAHGGDLDAMVPAMAALMVQYQGSGMETLEYAAPDGRYLALRRHSQGPGLCVYRKGTEGCVTNETLTGGFCPGPALPAKLLQVGNYDPNPNSNPSSCRWATTTLILTLTLTLTLTQALAGWQLRP